ncbi:MAG: helicase HerA domain-containing protein [Haloarculaceae archaeon]
MSAVPDEIRVTEGGHGLPVVELLTGRGFITGKSGSGKSNTATVIAESLLAHDLPFLIIDTDGEYFGLKDQYEVLHAGANDTCDVVVDVRHAPVLAELALDGKVPVVLDVSGYLDESEAHDLIREVVVALFQKEHERRQPFLLFVEEMHEYLPESGKQTELGDRLLQVAKRGRKRGLGMLGMSQRPAAVDKDFITQCDWIVWHRLTWNTDTQVVSRIIDAEAADTVETLDDGEALLMTDWDEQLQRVQFQRKSTFDAGATPDLGSFERPDLRSVDPEIVRRVKNFGDVPDDDAETDADSDDATGADDGDDTDGERSADGADGAGGAAATEDGDDSPHEGTGAEEADHSDEGGATGDGTAAEADDSGSSTDDGAGEGEGETRPVSVEPEDRVVESVPSRPTPEREPAAEVVSSPPPVSPQPASNPVLEVAHLFAYLLRVLRYRVAIWSVVARRRLAAVGGAARPDPIEPTPARTGDSRRRAAVRLGAVLAALALLGIAAITLL